MLFEPACRLSLIYSTSYLILSPASKAWTKGGRNSAMALFFFLSSPFWKSFYPEEVNLCCCLPSASPFPSARLLAWSLCLGPRCSSLLPSLQNHFPAAETQMLSIWLNVQGYVSQYIKVPPLLKEAAWQPVVLVAWRCKRRCPPIHFVFSLTPYVCFEWKFVFMQCFCLCTFFYATRFANDNIVEAVPKYPDHFIILQPQPSMTSLEFWTLTST